MRTIILHQSSIWGELLRDAVCSEFSDAVVMVKQRAMQAIGELRIQSADLIIAGLDLPDLDGLDYLPELIALSLARRVVVLCERTDARTLRKLIRLKTHALVDATSCKGSDLLVALRTIRRGTRYVSESLQARLSTPDYCPHILSEREEAVLCVLGEGCDNEEAASRFGLSPTTIRNHRANIMSKLQLRHKGELIAFALEQMYVRRTTEAVLHPGFERYLKPNDWLGTSNESSGGE